MCRSRCCLVLRGGKRTSAWGTGTAMLRPWTDGWKSRPPMGGAATGRASGRAPWGRAARERDTREAARRRGRLASRTATHSCSGRVDGRPGTRGSPHWLRTLFPLTFLLVRFWMRAGNSGHVIRPRPQLFFFSFAQACDSWVSRAIEPFSRHFQ